MTWAHGTIELPATVEWSRRVFKATGQVASRYRYAANENFKRWASQCVIEKRKKGNNYAAGRR